MGLSEGMETSLYLCASYAIGPGDGKAFEYRKSERERIPLREKRIRLIRSVFRLYSPSVFLTFG